MSYDSNIQRAQALVRKAADVEGSQRQSYLTQAKNILEIVPSSYPEKSELLNLINSMIH